MEEYLRGVLKDFPEEITETPETPATPDLFNVRDNKKRELLYKTRDQAFHHVVTQLLFTGIRCRKDAHTAIAFLTPILRKPDKDNCKKLRRLLRYLKLTIKLPLVLQSNGVNVLKWWVDASHAGHEDMWGHTGGTISMVKDGRGSIIIISKIQNLNTKKSTEAGLIGADRAIPQMLWTRYFLEAQVYGIDKNILYQDNMSAMLLEKNRKTSSTKNTTHINVRYYFIKYRVETGDVAIKHCPMEKMLGDHFTNCLQGPLSRKFRSEIMNIHMNWTWVRWEWTGQAFKRGSHENYITRLILDARRSVLGIVVN